MRLLPYGPRAVLAELDSLDDVIAAAAALRARALDGVIDVVPAARTVLVVHEPHVQHAAIADALSATTTVERPPGPLVEIAVRYDGIDLAAVAEATRRSVDDVIAAHAGAEHVVAFCGFMPGFAYLVGLPEWLHLPRRIEPRVRVPAGSVAVAGEFSAVYPSASPGGWHLLGRTDAVLWDDLCDEPALLAPGTRVRFQPS